MTDYVYRRPTAPAEPGIHRAADGITGPVLRQQLARFFCGRANLSNQAVGAMSAAVYHGEVGCGLGRGLGTVVREIRQNLRESS